MENLGEILKRLTPADTLRTTSNGGGGFQAAEEPEPEPGCPVCGDLGWVGRSVPVGHPDFGELFPCRCRRQAEEVRRLERLQRFSGLPPEMLRRMTFESFDLSVGGRNTQGNLSLRNAYTAASTFAKDPDGWLLLNGTHGSGKTHLAVAIVAECVKSGHPSLFTFVPDLLDHLRSSFRPTSDIEYDRLFEQVKKAPLLVLDDLGAESSTPWANEKMYQIVVHRHNSRLPTVITTYLPMEQMEESNSRLASRLKDTTLVNWVPMGVPDYRDSGIRPRGGGSHPRQF